MIKTGDKYRHEVTYTQEGVIAFAEITGDKNPIHLDPEFAAKTPFGRPIVHGFLSASVFSKVFGITGDKTKCIKEEQRQKDR